MSIHSNTPIQKAQRKPLDAMWARPKSWIATLLIFNFSLSRCSSTGTKTEPSTFRLSTLGLLLIFNFSLLTFHSCGLDVEDPTPPSPPVWVQKSLPEEWPERGIDAHESIGIFLEWESSIEEDIIAYSITRAARYANIDSLGDYIEIAHIETISMLTHDYIDHGIAWGVQYFYKIRAEDVSNNFSEYSDSITYTMLLNDNLGMFPNSVTDSLDQGGYLSWRGDMAIDMQDYCLTIVTDENELVSRVMFFPNAWTEWGQSWHLPQNISLQKGELYKWRIDMCAKYINGRETAGSESPWAIFTFSEQ